LIKDNHYEIIPDEYQPLQPAALKLRAVNFGRKALMNTQNNREIQLDFTNESEVFTAKVEDIKPIDHSIIENLESVHDIVESNFVPSKVKIKKLFVNCLKFEARSVKSKDFLIFQLKKKSVLKLFIKSLQKLKTKTSYQMWNLTC
jgi:hypothetical protein